MLLAGGAHGREIRLILGLICVSHLSCGGMLGVCQSWRMFVNNGV